MPMNGVGSSALIPRAMRDVVAEAMESARVVALLGPRQAGKSTLVEALAAEHMESRYLTFDDEGVRSFASSDPVGFIAGQALPTAIDEIQRAPEVLQAIKLRVDRDDEPGQFLITGSANLRRIPTVADALPGRVDYLTLWPLTQAEIEEVKPSFLSTTFAGRPPQLSKAPVGRDAYVDRLLTGGYPEARRRGATSRTRFFSGYVDSIVERDAVETSRINDPAALGTLLRLVAARSGSLARYQTLGRDSGIDGKTAKTYLDVLERLYLIRIRRPWHVNLGKRQVRAPKIYVADTGLLSTLIGADSTRLQADGGIAGAMFETFVATELERLASSEPVPYTFWHYRDGDREADIVIEAPSGDVVAIEVKVSATVRSQDFAGLRHLRDRLGDRFRLGVVLHTGGQTMMSSERIAAVPLAALWTGSA